MLEWTFAFWTWIPSVFTGRAWRCQRPLSATTVVMQIKQQEGMTASADWLKRDIPYPGGKWSAEADKSSGARANKAQFRALRLRSVFLRKEC